MRVLGIETSCDETGVALYDTEKGLLAHALHSQVDAHAVYGGVVPEIASRDHVRMLLPLIQQVMSQAGIQKPDAIAYTAGPGLVGALMVGSGLANGLGLAWDCPVVPVHHMEGHLLAPMLEDQPPEYPFLALLVSGGHSMLIAVLGLGRYQLLGTTLDDAVGEAFDKTAKLLGLGYPGGPALAALAESGNETAYELPRPMLTKPGYDFSFSGLKTAVMLEVRRAEAEGDLERCKADLAASFQRAAVDALIGRTLKAARKHGFERIVVAGGVGANRLLRQDLAARFDGKVYYPRLAFCTDNGAMIAVAWSRCEPPRLRHENGKGMDRIFLTDLRIDTIIGIWDWERRIRQTVVIDLEMSADIAHAAATDSVDDTLDYKAVAKRLQQFVGESSFQLVETLAERVAGIIRDEFDVAWVKVRVNKPGAIRGSRDVGVIIERGEKPN